MRYRENSGRIIVIWYDDRNSRFAALAERAFVRALDGGCSSPVAAHAVIDGEQLTLTGLYYGGEGDYYETAVLRGKVSEAEQIGKKLAGQFRKDIRVE